MKTCWQSGRPAVRNYLLLFYGTDFSTPVLLSRISLSPSQLLFGISGLQHAKAIGLEQGIMLLLFFSDKIGQVVYTFHRITLVLVHVRTNLAFIKN